MRSIFFDSRRTVLSPEEYLRQYLTKTQAIFSAEPADTLLKEAEEVFKKTKLIERLSCELTDEELEEVNLKALQALDIAAKKYEAENKFCEAACVYQLIESQANRFAASSARYQAPQFL